jgi:hypothetical protein
LRIGSDALSDLRRDIAEVLRAFRAAGVSPKLLESIKRKSLRTPRRQTGRVERRTNRQSRWCITADHPDYSTESDALLVFLKLILQIAGMHNPPEIDQGLIKHISEKYFGVPVEEDSTKDPITDEPLSYPDLVADVVGKPVHGYSKFHIGHQNPTIHPKHTPSNIRWQLKASNDFQGPMDVRVARIAFRINELTNNPDPSKVEEIEHNLDVLCRQLGIERE